MLAYAGFCAAILVGLIVALIVFVLTAYLLFMFRVLNVAKKRSDLTIAFFHPYCDAGGGGERVLWCGIRAIRKRFPAAKLVVFTGDTESAPDQIIKRARERFNLNLDDANLEFVYLHRRRWVEADMYPHFTLLGQSLGSIFLAFEALRKCNPHVYVDTMGYAFTLPVFRYFGQCKIGCYVHYPTISTDMLEKVRSRAKGYNNRRGIANSALATRAKLMYYKIFAWMYGKAGSCSDLAMVNSSWTEDHISKLWSSCQVVHKIYPPCDVSKFKQIKRSADVDDEEVKDRTAGKRIVSLGQFRPEKDHALQIRAMFELRQLIEESQWEHVKLVLIGGCRNAEDEQRVQDLRDLCKHLSVENNVEFKINIPFNELCDELGKAFMGLHTMWNEHFGIGKSKKKSKYCKKLGMFFILAVVEMMAAGLLTLAHRSGGPLMDIVVEESSGRNGFLAEHEKEYAGAIAYVLNNTTAEGRDAIRERARSSVDRFSEREFESGWIRATEAIINSAADSL